MKKIHSRIVRFMAYYLKKHCGGATHVYPYGVEGRYIVIMNEEEYNQFNNRDFFFTKRNVEVDLSVAAAIIETYVEEKYEFSPLTIGTRFDNQAKNITVYIFVPDNLSEYTDEEYKNFIEHIGEINLDAKEVVSKLLDRNDINLSIRVYEYQNPDEGYLIEIVNGKIEYSFR